MNALQSLLQESLIASGHVESCTLFKKKDGAIKASSVGYEVAGLWHCKVAANAYIIM